MPEITTSERATATLVWRTLFDADKTRRYDNIFAKLIRYSVDHMIRFVLRHEIFNTELSGGKGVSFGDWFTCGINFVKRPFAHVHS